jgi:hypothetical protein
MKKLILSALATLPAHAAIFWTENFEGYNLAANNLETQSSSAWYTEPANTPAIAVLGVGSIVPVNYGGNFGSKALAIGGVDPGGSPSDLSFGVSPTQAGFRPVAPNTQLRFSVDLLLNTGGSGQSLTDQFRFTFVDQSSPEVQLATLMFDNSDSGFATVIRDNMDPVDVGTFNTSARIPLNVAFTLNLVISPLLNKWSGSINGVSMFANVDMTKATTNVLGATAAPRADLGSFSIDWIKGGTTWGSNYLVADNFSLTAVPEPSVPVLASVFALAGILRRRR